MSEWREYVPADAITQISDTDRSILEHDINRSLLGDRRYNKAYFRKQSREIERRATKTEQSAEKYTTIAPSASNPFSKGSGKADEYITGQRLREHARSLHYLADVWNQVANKLPRHK